MKTITLSRIRTYVTTGVLRSLRFSSPLMTFAIEVIATLDREDPAYVVDVISVVESVLEDPRQVLHAQQNAARAAEIARLKAEGVPYEERIERLESITWSRPLAELLDAPDFVSGAYDTGLIDRMRGR